MLESKDMLDLIEFELCPTCKKNARIQAAKKVLIGQKGRWKNNKNAVK
jgi:hypothetical protein